MLKDMKNKITNLTTRIKVQISTETENQMKNKCTFPDLSVLRVRLDKVESGKDGNPVAALVSWITSEGADRQAWVPASWVS
jgi:hypothetical protein